MPQTKENCHIRYFAERGSDCVCVCTCALVCACVDNRVGGERRRERETDCCISFKVKEQNNKNGIFAFI